MLFVVTGRRRYARAESSCKAFTASLPSAKVLMVDRVPLTSEAETILGTSYSTPPGLLTFRGGCCKGEVRTDRHIMDSCVFGNVHNANLGLG